MGEGLSLYFINLGWQSSTDGFPPLCWVNGISHCSQLPLIELPYQAVFQLCNPGQLNQEPDQAYFPVSDMLPSHAVIVFSFVHRAGFVNVCVVVF